MQAAFSLEGGPPSPQAEASPLRPQNLVNLFVRPRTFFSSQLAFGATPVVVLVTYCFGVANTMQSVERNVMSARLGGSPASWGQIESLVMGSWLDYWLFALGVGALSAVLLWLIGGWWYRVRLRWSGAENPDKFRARLAYVYSSFIESGPLVLTMLVQTLRYKDYAALWEASDALSGLLIIFPFWSCFVSYAAVTSFFQLRQGRALLWFLILPGSLYAMALGMMILLALAMGV